MEGQLHAEKVGISRVSRLTELGVDIAIPGVVTQGLVDDNIIDPLVEDAAAHETYALEVILGVKVEVVADGGFEGRVAESDFVVVAVDADVGGKGRVLGRLCGELVGLISATYRRRTLHLARRWPPVRLRL